MILIDRVLFHHEEVETEEAGMFQREDEGD